MVASIGKIASPAQGVTYYERDGYYAKDDPVHKAASAWAGKGSNALGLSGPVDPDTFTAVLEGRVPDGPQLGRRDKEGSIHHRPGRDVTLSAPKSVSVTALVGGDDRVVAAHDVAVKRTLSWIERNAIETRMQNSATGTMVRAGGQKMVAATFRHDTSRNLDPQLHTHCVIGIQGYAGTGKTTMLDRVRSLAESRDYRVMGLAPSASAARTLGEEAGIESQTLQRFLARHAGIAEGRGSAKGLRNLRSSFRKTLLVVDEASLASTAQMRDLLRVATTLRIPRVVLVGDEKQLDGVEAGRPFAQLKQAGMLTVVMDEIVTAFEKLGDRVSEVERDALGVDVAMRWLELPDAERNRTGVIAPTRALRDEINAVIRGRLIEEGAIHGPARDGKKLVSRGLTNAEMATRSNYAPGDTVIFNRPYKTLGVEKGDERTVSKVDHKEGTVRLADTKGRTADWRPYLLAGAKGGVEVYRSEGIELRAGDRIRWTRNDPGSGLVNGQMAEVESVEKDGVRFRLDDGKTLKLAEGNRQLHHMDHGWASTVHAFQGRTVDNIIAAMESSHPHLTTRKAFYVAISRSREGAELVTDDAKQLADHLEKATGERVSALDAAKKYVTLGIEIGEEKTLEPDRTRNRPGTEAEIGRYGPRDVAERSAFRDGTAPKPNAVA